MKLYTKTGDDGRTGLLGGVRVSKDHIRVTAYGDVDELNAAIGFAMAAIDDKGWRATLRAIQGELFEIGAALATADGTTPTCTIDATRVHALEAVIDALSADLPPLKSFVLPGGGEAAVRFHLARTICRRAERSIVSLMDRAEVAADILTYINRLSDLMFAYALAVNHRAGVAEITWPASP